jgi:hypothetical protein
MNFVPLGLASGIEIWLMFVIYLCNRILETWSNLLTLNTINYVSRCIILWEHETPIYINQIDELYNGNDTCADQQP